jgi:hypothetical protein
VAALFAATPAHAADGDFVWARGMGGTISSDEARSIAVDSAGNVYTTGYFSGTVDFDPGAGTVNLTSAGSNEIFVQKLDASGNLVWARGMGGTSQDDSWSIAVDSAGNVYTTGFFEGTADFDPGAGTVNLTSAGIRDIFVQKLDASGTLVWARRMGGTISSDEARSIAVDSAGNVYTTGFFEGTVDFDPGAGTVNLSSAGNNEIFVQKLDASGNFVWARRMGGTSADVGWGIAVDSAGNVYTTGYFNGTVDFDPGAGTVNLTSAGSFEIFVQKLDASGNLVWARRMGGTSDDFGIGIAVDSADNVYTTGTFVGTADFDPGAGTVNLTSAGIRDIFVQKLDASGTFAWARRMGGTSFDQGWGIAVDPLGNVYTTGYFEGTVDFDPGAGTVNLSSAGNYEIFVQKLDASGNYVWARSMAGTSEDQGFGIAVDSAGNVYTTGYFSGTVDFDPGAGTVNLSSAGSRDIFVSKLSGVPPDTTPPVFSALLAAPSLAKLATAVTLTFTASETLSANPTVTVNGQAATYVSNAGNNYTYTYTIQASDADGAASIAISGTDVALNPSAFATNTAALTVDKIAPTVAIGAPSATLVNPLSTVSFPITVSGADTINLTTGDVSIAYAGSTSGGTVNVLNGTTATPTVEVSNVGATSAGHYTISIAAGVASDLSANLSLAAGPSAQVFVDGTGPIVTIGVATGAPISSTSGELVFAVQILGANTINLTESDVTVGYAGSTSGGVLSVLNGNTAFATVLLSQVSGDGYVTISVDPGVASDTAGNQSAAAGPSELARVDNSAPSYSNLSADPASASAGQDVSLEFFTTEFTTTDPEVTVNGNPAVRTAKGAPIYFYTYTVLPTDPEGPASIVISGIDDAANVGSFSDNSALTILPSEEPLPVVAWPLGVALATAGGLALRRKARR